MGQFDSQKQAPIEVANVEVKAFVQVNFPAEISPIKRFPRKEGVNTARPQIRFVSQPPSQSELQKAETNVAVRWVLGREAALFHPILQLQPNHIRRQVVFRFRENDICRDHESRARRFSDDSHGASLADRDLLAQRVQPAVDQIRVAGTAPVKSDNLNKLVTEFVPGRVFDFVEVDPVTIHGSGSLHKF